MTSTAHGFRIAFNPVTDNPRAVRFVYATGRRFSGKEFIPWMMGCWAAFCREHGVRNQDEAILKFKLGLQDAFDAWHDDAVFSGRFAEVAAVVGTHD